MPRQNKTSKFITIYGMTLEQIAARLGVSPYKAYTLHLQRKIKIPAKVKRCPTCHAYTEK